MPNPVKKPPKKAKGHKMAPPMPNGLVIQDITKKKWKLGPSIGKGGFGEIYSAQALTDTSQKTYPYVIKIEPHDNGPLFVEMHFYMRIAKSDQVTEFKTNRKLKSFGMPEYIASGSHNYNGEKYRFLVMHKFGNDVWKIFTENNRKFPTETVFKLGVQILDVLEYIHSKGYIHGDIKGANILLGIGKEAQTQVYLVDFGLCSHYGNSFKPDPKKAHNGTIEYLSRDAHLGVESRRGDLEILGYNLTQWLCGVLPWETNTNPVDVQNSKKSHMDDLPKFFKSCFKSSQPPAALVNYFKYITSLKFENVPDYKKIRQILQSGVETAGGSLMSPIQFNSKRRISKSASPARKRNTSAEPTNRNLSEIEILSKSQALKKNKSTKDVETYSELDNIATASSSKKKATTSQKKVKNVENSAEKESDANTSTYGFTEEMIQIKRKLDGKNKSDKSTNKTKNVENSAEKENAANTSTFGFTEEMIEIKRKMDIKNKSKRNKKIAAVEDSDENEENNIATNISSDSYKDEMVQVAPSAKSKSKPQINNRPKMMLRKRKINTETSSVKDNGLNDSVLIISNSESEEEIKPKRKLTKKVK